MGFGLSLVSRDLMEPILQAHTLSGWVADTALSLSLTDTANPRDGVIVNLRRPSVHPRYSNTTPVAAMRLDRPNSVVFVTALAGPAWAAGRC